MKHYFLLLVLLVAGCGSGEFQITNVSGTVTFDDEPLVGAEVVFAPMGEADAIDVGPVSVGTTDAEGRYSLTTIRGQKGAVVTKHRVSVGLKDISRSEVARRLDEEYAKKPRMSEGEFLALERKIRQSMRKELGPLKSIPENGSGPPARSRINSSPRRCTRSCVYSGAPPAPPLLATSVVAPES